MLFFCVCVPVTWTHRINRQPEMNIKIWMHALQTYLSAGIPDLVVLNEFLSIFVDGAITTCPLQCFVERLEWIVTVSLVFSRPPCTHSAFLVTIIIVTWARVSGWWWWYIKGLPSKCQSLQLGKKITSPIILIFFFQRLHHKRCFVGKIARHNEAQPMFVLWNSEPRVVSDFNISPGYLSAGIWLENMCIYFTEMILKRWSRTGDAGGKKCIATFYGKTQMLPEATVIQPWDC